MAAVNPVLERILDSRVVADGHDTYPLHSNMQPEEGRLIQQIIATVKPSTTLEVGMAYGVSTLYICDALARLAKPIRHIAIDPYQSTVWRGIGLGHVREAGFDTFVEVHEQGSEFVLPRLLAEGIAIELAIIDGWHTFDHALLDFFYINRMLSVGGVAVFDDVNYESIHKLVRYILNYPGYEVIAAAGSAEGPPSLFGRVRRRFARTTIAKKVLREDLLTRPWDAGWGSCVALRKRAADTRNFDWYVDF
jgi:predicted O-methyltransferase YrrM